MIISVISRDACLRFTFSYISVYTDMSVALHIKCKYIKIIPTFTMISPSGITNPHLLVQINNENTKTMCEICLKLTVKKTPERRH